MTKKIAVVGCSFSAFWQGDQTSVGDNHNVKTWSHHLVDNFDVTVDNYAQNGTSVGYVNYCLNYIYNNPNLEYDLIIGNIPPLNRDWYFAFNRVDDVTDHNNLSNYEKWFEHTQEQDRVRIFNISPTIVNHAHNDVVNIQGSDLNKLGHKDHDYVKNHYDHTKNNFMLNHRKNLQNVQIAREFYGKLLPFTFWYHATNLFVDDELSFDSIVNFKKLARHTIIHEEHAKGFFRNNYYFDSKAKFQKEFLVDDSHFSTYGHEQLLEKYILTDNKINSIIVK